MDMIEISGSPNIFHEGVYYSEDSPLYIVEYFDNEYAPETYATVYEVAEASRKEDASEEAKQFPRKAYERKVVRRGYGDLTPLAKKAAEIHEPEQFVREVERPPVFMARIQYGEDTFTGYEGMGFYERTKDRFVVGKGGNGEVVGGKNTGVFITLDSIDWRRHYVPTSDALNKYAMQRTLWDGLL